MDCSANRPRKILTAWLVAGLLVALPFLPVRTSSVAAADAAAIFKSKCVSCHAADGSGNTAVGKRMKLRDLRSAEIQGMSDDALFNVIANGKGKMPGYSKSLGADTCRALVAYVRKLK
jgi:mono/diheme cytochrome c family protein